jgi:hypothetical protein
MTTLTYNNFKSTTVRGDFHNADDTTNSIIANSIIDRDIHIGGNIYCNAVQCSSGFIFNTTTIDFSGNVTPFEICKLSVTDSTFNNIIKCPAIKINGVDLITLLLDYVTQNDFQTLSLSLDNYQLISNMINYVTLSSLISTLNNYQLISNMTNYITNTNLTSTLNNYVLTSSLSNYQLISNMTNYVTTTNLNSTLNNYQLISNMTNYITTTNLTSTLNNYVLTTTLNSTLTNYALKSSLSNYANLTATSNTFTGNFQIGSLSNNGSPTFLVYAQTTINGDVWLNSDVNIGTINNFFNVLSISYFDSLVTFNAGINTISILLNGVDLNTRLNTYVLTSALNTTLSNYVTNTSLNNQLKTFTHTAGLGFNASTFPSNSSGDYKYGYEVFWNNTNGGGETDFLAYGQGGSGGFKFYSLNTSSSSSTPYELMYMHPSIGTKINTNLTVTGIQNSCRKSITYLNSNFYLTTGNITEHYIITNNASISFNCFAPTQNVTDGYEINIRNAGNGIINITGCVPTGFNINTQSFNLIQYQACKIVSGNDYWYQI